MIKCTKVKLLFLINKRATIYKISLSYLNVQMYRILHKSATYNLNISFCTITPAIKFQTLQLLTAYKKFIAQHKRTKSTPVSAINVMPIKHKV